MRFGTSESPKRTRSSTAISAPAALRPWRYATPLLRSVLAPHHYRKWLDAMLGWLLCFPYAASRLRENSAPSSLLGTTGHRFAIHGRQRVIARSSFPVRCRGQTTSCGKRHVNVRQTCMKRKDKNPRPGDFGTYAFMTCGTLSDGDSGAAGVSKEARSALLRHRTGDIATHYSAPEMRELLDAVRKISQSNIPKTPAAISLNSSTASIDASICRP